jgi:hypothetical protein
MVSMRELTMTNHRGCPFIPERLEAVVSTECGIIRSADDLRQDRFVITCAKATDDPCVARVTVEPNLVWSLP